MLTCSISMHQAFKPAHTSLTVHLHHVNTPYVCYSHSMCVFIDYTQLYQYLRPYNEIHWVMLTLASRLTNRQSYIKRTKHSTQPLLPLNLMLSFVWMVCEGEWVRMDGNVVVYLLYIWVRVNMLCAVLCFKSSSCLSQTTKLIIKTQLYNTRKSIQNNSVKILMKICRENDFKNVYQFTQ